VENKHVRHWAVVAALCLCRGIWGQASQIDVVKGEVHGDSPGIFCRSVTLDDLVSHYTIASTDLKVDGSFEFHNLPAGQYRLTVLTPNGEPVYATLVSVLDRYQPLLVNLPKREAESKPAGPVSAAELLHPPAKKAVAAFWTARKLADAGNYERAARELEKAVAISPQFGEAWVNLAAQNIHLHRYQPALDDLTHASAIIKPDAIILGNTAIAQLALHREEEAMQTARRALQIDSAYAPAHFLLGAMLAIDPHTLPEAIAHLEIAARSIPAARDRLERARRSENAMPR
jgi:tetratricopeptide (TPR) repeat protein